MSKIKTVLIVGGKLQGLEAVYLAKKAGMRTILLDRRSDVLAKGLCDVFINTDIFDLKPEFVKAVSRADLVIPALEDEAALQHLIKQGKKIGFKVAFDMEAYMLTSSKLRSDQLFRENSIPAPAYYPNCAPPYLVKPSGESGSLGVRIFETAQEVESFLRGKQTDDRWIAQEYVSGQGYSIEVIGKPGSYRTYETTTIIVDESFDCCQVLAPSDLTDRLKGEFKAIALKLAEIINLHGIMDIEAIEHNGDLKVLEIDARIPSQTPIAVYQATGVNMIEELADLFCDEKKWEKGWRSADQAPKKQASYDVMQKSEIGFSHRGEEDTNDFGGITHRGEGSMSNFGGIVHRGEGIMSDSQGVTFYQNYHGADEAMVDDKNGCMRGIFINSANTKAQLEQKRRDMMLKLSGV